MTDPLRSADGQAPTQVSPRERATPRPAQADALIGTKVGHLRIVRTLGVGGMGTVYLAEHEAIASKVAIKFLHPHLCSDRSLVARFLDEARAVNLIGHHHIVSIIDLDVLPPDRYYMVMELLEGSTLAARLNAGRVELRTALSIIIQICDALGAAHSAGIVHRDLKPDNIFLVRRGGDPDYVKLVDFGIAKILSRVQGNTAVGRLIGTPEYMAPEQWSGEAIDGRADLYALGTIAYELATGRRPFAGKDVMELFRAHLESRPVPPRQLEPALPEAFEQLILKALSRDPARRFGTADEMARAAQALLRALDTPTPPTPAPARPPSQLGRASTYSARVEVAGAGGAREVTVSEVSRAGLFVRCGPPFPEIFARVRVTVTHPEGALSIDGEVVRSVTADQARAWAMEPGFAVQVREASLGQRQALERLARGLAPAESAAARADDSIAEQLLKELESRRGRDPYGLLKLARDCEGTEVHRCVRETIQRLVSRAEKMSPAQRERADSQLERLHAALTVLGTPRFRAGHDAEEGNFRGVARCLQAGLAIEELEGLQASFAQHRPDEVRRAEARGQSARSQAIMGNRSQALVEYEEALVLDPLSLELLRSYWTLKRNEK